MCLLSPEVTPESAPSSQIAPSPGSPVQFSAGQMSHIIFGGIPSPPQPTLHDLEPWSSLLLPQVHSPSPGLSPQPQSSQGASPATHSIFPTIPCVPVPDPLASPPVFHATGPISRLARPCTYSQFHSPGVAPSSPFRRLHPAQVPHSVHGGPS